MNSTTSPAIAVSPIRTFWTDITFWIINAFFVRTTDNPICNYNASHRMFFDKLQNFFVDRKISSNICVLRNPPLHVCGLSTFLKYNADRYF